MRWTSRIAAAALVALLQACATPPAQTPPPPAAAALEARTPVTILISIDGFRADYLQRGVTPNLARLAAEGITGPMRPSFPSKTFPNHWTLVTGVVPDHHGIVGNRMEDAGHPGETFTTASDAPYWWNAAQPIWVAAEKAGIRTGTVFWPGANVAWGSPATRADHGDYPGGTRPHDWLQYNQAIRDSQRVDTVLDWLRRPAASRPRFLTLYFDKVDTVGHAHGPDAVEATQAAGEIDTQIGALLEGLEGLRQPANIVVVSDHGMSETSDIRVIPLGLPKDSYHLIEAGPFAALNPAAGQEALVEKTLLGRHPHMECWRKADIPARFRYGTNPRIAAIFCLAEPRWMIVEKLPDAPYTRGEHGYDNQSTDMAALFVAAGPAFRHGTLPAFDNVDVYPLLRDLIGLPPRTDVDGDDAPFRHFLRPR
ncbi:ectonucleotide pyrophosphatase/phosphodiesterase [Sphingomonas sp. R1]|uniref:alkaline phosphatase family protein n=1 Tax=Sphingomonas sp. R1 TaxID=399176 RepID=UPI002224F513|nr:ectonucleotide pyrophosphatase/phosphodiesterase [Sphingomonas sp. R1]UYY78965.1 ectonucleotide pyrophosphatase/phosphodiesterase [Sphingomonas sp. R1]